MTGVSFNLLSAELFIQFAPNIFKQRGIYLKKINGLKYDKLLS